MRKKVDHSGEKNSSPHANQEKYEEHITVKGQLLRARRIAAEGLLLIVGF